ncbi:MAG: AraC family transcriptional regulator [Sphingobacteriales bacterium]|nr:MAG: AraC family transcriptional regulator [Sphingobacteriales bacterium]
MTLYIKYMVSRRYIMMVRDVFKRLNIELVCISLGEVTTISPLSSSESAQLKIALLESGLELMEDSRAILIQKIKNVIIETVHHSEELPKTTFSNFLSDRLDYDYTYLANCFSEVTGITIEHFMIAHRIERVKELIIYDELNLTAIADKLHYSSVAHLSNQFKKVTGLTPTFFKALKQKKRTVLEDV